MNDMIELYFDEGKEGMDKAIKHLKDELFKIRTGKANPAMISSLMVEYYGTPTAVSQVANIATPDSRTISIQPWEKNMLGAIERSIFEANLGLTPMNDGEFVRISIPPLTEERRKTLVKQAKALGEDAKVGLRSVRHKMIDGIKKEVKDGYSEDMGKDQEANVESMVKQYTETIGAMVAGKEVDIMTI